MSIKFQCEHCGAHLKADEATQGEVLPCVQCQEEVTVPMPVGQCPCCGTSMQTEGRSWHLALFWLVLGGTFTVVLLAIAESPSPSFLGVRMSSTLARVLGGVLGLLALVICTKFILEWVSSCPNCGTAVLARRPLRWSVAGGADRCVCCEMPMLPWSGVYRVVGVAYALAFAFLTFGGPLLWYLTGEGWILGGLGIVVAFTCFLRPAIMRFRLRALRCPRCKTQTVIPSR